MDMITTSTKRPCDTPISTPSQQIATPQDWKISTYKSENPQPLNICFGLSSLIEVVAQLLHRRTHKGLCHFEPRKIEKAAIATTLNLNRCESGRNGGALPVGCSDADQGITG
jgi:hypothetical protein